MRVLLATLLLLCATGCRVAGTKTVDWGTTAEAALPGEFSVLSWNVQKAQDKRLTSRLQALVTGLDPDLVFLQEARLDILDVDGFGAIFAPGWAYPWPGGREIGVAILSRTAPVSFEKLVTEDREFGITAPKVSLAQTWHLPDDETLLLVNVHGLAFETGKKLRAFRRQLEAIEAVAAQHDGPVLLAGDFNTWSVYRLQCVQQMAKRLGLAEVDAYAGPVRRTTADKGSSNPSLGVNPDLPIDHVYVRRLDVLEARVLDEDVSDHRPLFVRLAVTGE